MKASVALALGLCLLIFAAAEQGGPGGGGGPGDGGPRPANGTAPGPAPVNGTAGGPGGPGGGQGGSGGGGPGGPGGAGPAGPGTGGGPSGPGGGGPGGGQGQGQGPINGTGAPPRGDGNGTRPEGGNGNQGGGGDNQGPRPPRGDDPRPRMWGQTDGNNETQFDDRKSPRRIGFLGRSPNMRIYPNYSDTSVWLQLQFSKVAELDAAGRPVPRHAVPTLADIDPSSFTPGNRTIGGVNASFVNVTLDPRTRPGFNPLCGPPGSGDDGGDNGDGQGGQGGQGGPGGQGGQGGPGGAGGSNGRRALLADPSSPSPPPSPPPMPPAPSGVYAPMLSVELLFGLDDVLTLQYGPDNVTVPRNGLKWTVAYRNWPFCNTSNALSVTLNLLLPGNASAQITTGAAGDSQKLSFALGSSYNASLTFLNYALDSPTGSIKMPANITLNQTGSVVSINMVLPNPAKYNATSVWYDPTTTTTSAYLAADDPGNGYIAPVLTSGGNGTNGGDAAAVRPGLGTTVMVALMAVLLVALRGGLAF